VGGLLATGAGADGTPEGDCAGVKPKLPLGVPDGAWAGGTANPAFPEGATVDGDPEIGVVGPRCLAWDPKAKSKGPMVVAPLVIQ
jgi:hypothetical protein